MTKSTRGAIQLALCALFWSTGGVFVKSVNASSFFIAGFRSLTALIVFLIVLRRPPVFTVRDEQNKIDRPKTLYLWLAGILYAATMILFCMANKLTTAANTILLQYTNPIYIILFSPLLLGEKNSRWDYCTAFGVMCGIVLFFAGDLDAGNFLGNILAALSGLTFGFCTIYMRKQRTTGSENSFMIAHLVTAVAGISIGFAGGGSIPAGDWQSWIKLISCGIIQMAFATILYSRGIGKVTALSAGIITMIEPLMNPVWVMIFGNEVPGVLALAGGAIILGCILLREIVNYYRHYKKENGMEAKS